jgi:hypothetical protein
MRYLKILGLGVLVLGVVACGKDDDENNNVTVAPAAPITGPTDPAGGQLLISGGNFVSAPVTDISRRHGGRACSTYELQTSGTALTLRQKVRENTDCTGALLGEILLTGTVTELQPQSTTTHDFSLTIQSVRMIPHSILWTQEFGSGNSGDCQVEMMPLNSEADVAGKRCGILGDFPAVGSVFQSRYRFEGQNTLRMSFAPYELPTNVRRADEDPAPRATRMNVVFTRVGTAGDTSTATDTGTSTSTSTLTSTATATSTGTGTGTATALR